MEIEVGVRDVHLEEDRGVFVRKCEFRDVVLPEAVALGEVVVDVVEREQVPEEGHHHQENHHEPRNQNLPPLVLQMLVVQQVVVRRAYLYFFLLNSHSLTGL